ncbi:hypothetical protein D1007_23607 [Hordeum vulgare]|nr:hypothetical protein D1007_23607 [Hordeum vulgare]
MGCGGTEEAIRPLLARTCAPSFPEPGERESFPSSLSLHRPSPPSTKPPPSAVMSSDAPKKGQRNGAWLGSDICNGHIEALRHRRLLPPASVVAARVPGAANSPTPREGEVVVFDEHFYRGFGLPASNFFSNFLIFFGLQPRHLAPNSILQLAAYVVLCKGFLGIEPRLDLWQKLFFFKQQYIKLDKAEAEKLTGPRPMTSCGATLVHHRTTCGFPHMPLQDSIKLWQRGFFYVKNVDPSHDVLNLPPFIILLRRREGTGRLRI